ncbi:N-acylamino acid racemase [uncultured archaeon]|nr:N-acylamino acid racemase [uncultured archaeon]
MTGSLNYYKVKMPLVDPFTTSFGTETEKEAYIFELKKDGISAFSESVTSIGPFYSYEDNTTAFHIIKSYLAELVLDAPQPAEFIARSSKVKGHNMAKAALEMLLWDYHSRKSGKPLHEYIGKSKGYADVGISLGIDRKEATLKKIQAALDRGYKRIKVKISKGKEMDILTPIREVYPDIALSVDANTDYRLRDLEILKKLDRFNLVYIEQPLEHDDILDHARLRKEISTPICLDESITSAERAEQALEVEACEVINIKPGRVGGFTESLKIAELARERKAHVWVGGMLETGIGRSYNVALASLEAVDYPGDTSPNDKYFERDLVRNPFSMENGTIRPNSGTGIGVDIDFEMINKVKIEAGTF